MDERLITTPEAAKILGVSSMTVLNWAKQGRFPAIRYGGPGRASMFRFRHGDIVAYRDRSRLPGRPCAAAASVDPGREPSAERRLDDSSFSS